jgi:hypothetical protein
MPDVVALRGVARDNRSRAGGASTAFVAAMLDHVQQAVIGIDGG